MLKKLYIRNFLYIKNLDLDFKKGLSIFTGETGVGKSLILKTISYCLGEKLPGNFINTESQSILTLEFEINNKQSVLKFLNNFGFAESKNNTLIIRREILDFKKSKFFLNDIPITIQLLKQLSEYLIEYQGQHSQLLLLDSRNHLRLIDQYAEIFEDLENLTKYYINFQEISKELAELKEKKVIYETDIDYQKHTLEELQKLAIKDNEEENLKDAKRKIQDSEKLRNHLQKALTLLSNDLIEKNFIECYREILACEDKQDLDFTQDLQEIDSLSNMLSNLINSIKEKQKLLSDGIDLEEIEDRLDLIRTVARKHRVNSKELPQIMDKAEKLLRDVSNIDNQIKLAEIKLKDIRDNYQKLALIISLKRKDAALSLEKKIVSELSSLNMIKTVLKIDIKTDNTKISKEGFDTVEFLTSHNPGTPLAPLKNISSGGELSRLILAIKIVLSIKDAPETIIFDEIDSGLGGSAADAVGEKLLLLSKKFQLILVTHHQQVASRADAHYVVKKQYENDSTSLILESLDYQERLEEIARMISGKNITQEAIQAAAQLLNFK